jgi:hypothetical protein
VASKASQLLVLRMRRYGQRQKIKFSELQVGDSRLTKMRTRITAEANAEASPARVFSNNPFDSPVLSTTVVFESLMARTVMSLWIH